MIWQNTKVRIAIIASLVLLAIIAYRIYGNIQANNERANRVSQGQNIGHIFPAASEYYSCYAFCGQP